MSEQATQFHIEEFKALRDEMSDLSQENRTTRYQALIGTVAVFAWLSVNEGNDISPIGWFIPLLFPIFGFIRYFGNMRRVMNIAEYIVAIEEKILGKNGGWEHFIRGQRKGRIDEMRGTDLARWSIHSFWTSLFFIDILLIIYVFLFQ